jgi:hypothetical protein
MFRFLIFLLGMLTVNRPGQRESGLYRTNSYGSKESGTLLRDPDGAGGGDAWPGQPEPLSPWHRRAVGNAGPESPAGKRDDPGPRRRRIPLRVKWTAAIVVVALIFRKAIASVVLVALSAALHLVGINVHLPSIKFAWPWQTISTGTTGTELGPWVLQKIEGISKPALGTENFNFLFTHKVSKAHGRAGMPVPSTPSATRPPRLTSIQALPGGRGPPATTGCRSSAAPWGASLVT